MEAVLDYPVVITDMKSKMKDILMSISWRDFANTYFQKSLSWFYHKMDGIECNGGEGGFDEEEAEQMRGALIGLSNRIRRAASRDLSESRKFEAKTRQKGLPFRSIDSHFAKWESISCIFNIL